MSWLAVVSCVTPAWAAADKVSESAAHSQCEQQLRWGVTPRDPLPAIPAFRNSVCECVASEAPGLPQEGSAGERQAAQAALARRCYQRAQQALLSQPVPDTAVSAIGQVVPFFAANAEFRSALLVSTVCPRLDYPFVAVRAEAVGTTVVALKISSTGQLLGKYLVQSAGPSYGHKALDEAVITMLGQCKYEPARLNGQAVEGWTRIEYLWKLE